MKTVGNYHDGKMFYENDDKTGRWAKVMVTKLSYKTIKNVALGNAGEVVCFLSTDHFKKQIHCAQYATDWVNRGWY